MVTGFLFVAGALFVHDKLSNLAFWVSIIFFGGGSFFTLRELLYANKNAAKSAAAISERERKYRENPGHFIFDDKGFNYNPGLNPSYHLWSDIDSIFASETTYWDDRFTVTEPCLHIFTNDGNHLLFSKSTYGWHQFSIRLYQNFPQINKDWAQTVSGNKHILLFDKKGRTQEQALKLYFPS